jgi:hypothetical protein
MYHPAQVQEIITTDSEPKFLVQTWDENTLTVDAGEDVETDSISQGDIVLLDYTPRPDFQVPTPKQVVGAVLKDEQGKRVWNQYRELFNQQPNQQTAMAAPNNAAFDGNYIG